LNAANKSSSALLLPLTGGEVACAKFEAKGLLAGVPLLDGIGGDADDLFPNPSQNCPLPNCTSYCFLFSSSCFLFCACNLSCCSCNVKVVVLEEPKDTRFEKLSGVEVFGGANGFGAPEACAERGVLRPESWGGGVGLKVG
jgi:hypothetical protein